MRVGRQASFISLLIAMAIAPMLSNLDQAFQYIQEFTGFVSPGALAIFLAGFFFKPATANGALVAAIGSFVLSVLLMLLFPDLPWMDRMGIVFLLCCLLIVLLRDRTKDKQLFVHYKQGLFKTSTLFNVFSLIIVVILVVFYYIWW